MTYFNTTHVRGQELSEYKVMATRQETLIYEFFRRNSDGQWTPEDIKKLHPNFLKVPITSIRRAFTNLKDSYIYKTDHKVLGRYGRPIYTWKVRLPFQLMF